MGTLRPLRSLRASAAVNGDSAARATHPASSTAAPAAVDSHVSSSSSLSSSSSSAPLPAPSFSSFLPPARRRSPRSTFYPSAVLAAVLSALLAALRAVLRGAISRLSATRKTEQHAPQRRRLLVYALGLACVVLVAVLASPDEPDAIRAANRGSNTLGGAGAGGSAMFGRGAAARPRKPPPAWSRRGATGGTRGAHIDVTLARAPRRSVGMSDPRGALRGAPARGSVRAARSRRHYHRHHHDHHHHVHQARAHSHSHSHSHSHGAQKTWGGGGGERPPTEDELIQMRRARESGAGNGDGDGDSAGAGGWRVFSAGDEESGQEKKSKKNEKKSVEEEEDEGEDNGGVALRPHERTAKYVAGRLQKINKLDSFEEGDAVEKAVKANAGGGDGGGDGGGGGDDGDER